MQNATITVSGEILNAYETSWRDPETKRDKTSKVVQFLRDDMKGRTQVLNVKVPDTADLSVYPKGKKVSMTVDVIAMDSQLYFRAMGDAQLATHASQKTGTS